MFKEVQQRWHVEITRSMMDASISSGHSTEDSSIHSTLQPVSEIQFDRIWLKLSGSFSANSFLIYVISSGFQDLQFFARSSWQNPPFRRFFAAGQQMLHFQGLQSWGYVQLWLHPWIQQKQLFSKVKPTIWDFRKLKMICWSIFKPHQLTPNCAILYRRRTNFQFHLGQNAVSGKSVEVQESLGYSIPVTDRPISNAHIFNHQPIIPGSNLIQLEIRHYDT